MSDPTHENETEESHAMAMDFVMEIESLRAKLAAAESANCRMRAALRAVDDFLSRLGVGSGNLPRDIGEALASSGPCPHETKVKRLRALCIEGGRALASFTSGPVKFGKAMQCGDCGSLTDQCLPGCICETAAKLLAEGRKA